ncbi:MAG: hypothetical protein ACPGGJ_02560 [Coraliomargarita sp.]
MRISKRLLPVLLLAGTLPAGFSHADRWMHGAFYLPAVPEGITISTIGGKPLPAMDFPGVAPGRLRFSGFSREGILAAGSNGFSLAYYGMGTLAFERFEQRVAPGRLDGISRSILSMDAGWIQFDGRAMPGGSQVLLELPFGRVLLDSVLGSARIEYDARSRIYSFELLCAEGAMQFSDMQGGRYEVYAGQAISGAGTFLQLSLEISDLTERSRGTLAVFAERCGVEADALEARSASMLEAMSPVYLAEETAAPVNASSDAGLDDRQPYVIEFSPSPRLLLPRYGTTRRLSESEARLF